MFGSKKRLFRRVTGYVDAIKMVVYFKLQPELQKKYDEEQAKPLSAAVVNRLFGSAASPMHANIPATLIDEVATDFLRNEEDKDLLHGIVMSLRTKATLKTAETDARNMEVIDRISDTVQWVKTIIPLPPEAPDPNMMERLASMLQSRYC